MQVGQVDETPDDNWETVAMVNRLSCMEVGHMPSEFTVTPMQNVPLGLMKIRAFTAEMLDESQLAVYYACYRHLLRIARREALEESEGNLFRRTAMSTTLNLGAWGMLFFIERLCKRRGLDLEEVKRYGLN